MEAIVLAGGLGTRLRKMVPDLPKPMAPVGGRPFLEILLGRLAGKGFKRIVLSVGYLADKVINHFGENFLGMELVYEVEDEPLGTGGAIRRALTRCFNDHIFVFNGDTYLDLEVDEVEALWLRSGQPVVVAREVPDTQRFGRLEIHEGRIRRFIEKGASGSGLINAGCYVIPRDLLNAFPVGKIFSLENDFLKTVVAHRHISVFITRGLFIDIGVPDDYVRAQTMQLVSSPI